MYSVCQQLLKGTVTCLQAMVESLLSEYPNVLVLRVRMPIVGDLLYPRNFITKIIKYEKVSPVPDTMLFRACTYLKSFKALQGPSGPSACSIHSLGGNLDAWSHELMAVMQVVNIPNSMTVLPELLPYSIEMVRRLLMLTSAKPSPACL